MLAGRRQAPQKVFEHLARGLLLARIVHQQLLQIGEQLNVALIVAGTEGVRIGQQELAQTLNGQMIEVAVAVLHQIGQPRHRLRGALPLNDVQQ